LSLLITRFLLRQLGGEPATAVAVARAVAEGDLTTESNFVRATSAGLMARLQAMQRALAEAVANGPQQLVTSSRRPVRRSRKATRICRLAPSTSQRAAGDAATMEQLGQTVHGNAENAHQASQLAEGASTVAARGGAVVGEVVATMKGINDSSRKIADIIASSTASRSRPTSWRSTPRSKRRERANKVAASRSSRAKCAAWHSAVPKRHARSGP
jgi:methyl-accepting chemotaxis protein